MYEILAECVPNISEGRDRSAIGEMAAAFDAEEGAALLHVDPNPDANRTVFTIAGEPESLERAVLKGLRRALSLVDMRKHSGAHPRMGAVDVVPFVPIRGLSLSDCVGMACAVGTELGKDGLPVYLYEAAARRPERRNLAFLRKGEYEGLSLREGDPAWFPDYGPRTFVPAWGAAAVGARPFLIAWNMSILPRELCPPSPTGRLCPPADLEAAKVIARELRGSGSGKTRGLFPGLKCIGWIMEGYGLAQVSCNIVSIEEAPLAEVWFAAQGAAERLGYTLIGSELIGLCPLSPLLAAGRAFSSRGVPGGQSSADGPQTETALVQAAVKGLGLELHGPFVPEKRVLEWVAEEALQKKVR